MRTLYIIEYSVLTSISCSPGVYFPNRSHPKINQTISEKKGKLVKTCSIEPLPS